MAREIFCQKLNSQLPGLEEIPYPGELGQRIYDSISAVAWERWLRYQTFFMNENNLSAINPDHIEAIESQMVQFLFNEVA